MLDYKYFFTPKFLLFVFVTLLVSVDAVAQVVVDVSKITCDQFATYKIENPEYIAIWLDGYYHGTRGDMKVDIQTLSADAKKVEMPEQTRGTARPSSENGAGHLCWTMMGVRMVRIWPSRCPLEQVHKLKS